MSFSIYLFHYAKMQMHLLISWLNRDFPCGSARKESAHSAGDLGWIPGLGRFPGEGQGYPLQYSGLDNFIDHIFHGVPKSWTQLSGFHFHFSVKEQILAVGEHLTFFIPLASTLPLPLLASLEFSFPGTQNSVLHILIRRQHPRYSGSFRLTCSYLNILLRFLIKMLYDA